MFYFIFVLCCKNTTKSNNYQIFKGKSYYIVYYLTFLNIKIKYYYLFTYYLLYYYYYILYVGYYIIYLIIYKEKKQTGKEGKKRKRNRRERGTGQRMPPPSSPVPRLSSVPSAASPSAPSPALNTSPSHREIGRAGTLPRLWVMLSPPPRHRSTSKQKRCRPSGLSVILPPLACVLLSAAPPLSSSFSRSSLRPDLFRSLLPDVLPAILPASSPLPGGEG